ncbi:LuxR C-terminal-related transcriptional regulator [Serratia fonticola]|uniref:LuxR C-terminal-related transcriptional regulator n=1 Tax=Serratia fonticola TaxID=47917 RepID=UPI0035A58A7C
MKRHANKGALTKREKLIIRHTINSVSVNKLRHYISISTKTVYSHKRKAFHKLAVICLNFGPSEVFLQT